MEIKQFMKKEFLLMQFDTLQKQAIYEISISSEENFIVIAHSMILLKRLTLKS